MTPEETKEDVDSVPLHTLVFDLLGTILRVLAILFLFLALFCRQVTVDEDSMNDTLENNHRLLVACMGYEPKCGDIVIVSHGANLPDPIVKRVIATAGQTLEIDSSTGDVIVDGVLLKEDYVKGITMVRSGFDGIRIPKVIPEGYIFVMGDNRENSKDSRSADVGLVPVENVIGKAYARWFPFNKIGNI